jgi:hypothetical protein
VRLYLLVILFILTGYLTASGQYSYVGTATASATLNNIMGLSITNLNTSINFNSTTAYSSGIVNTGYAQLKIKCNNTWTLSIKSQNQYFTALSSGASTDMPATVLYIKPTTSSTYLNITTSDQTLATGLNGPETLSGNTFNFDLKMTPGYAYKGGLYNISLLFTLTAP